MTVLNLNDQSQSNSIAVTVALEKSRIAIAHFANTLVAKIQKTRKSPKDILAAQQRRIEAAQRVDHLRGMIR